ncbi:MAG: ABC transporter ATP-binding protein [Candidatus Lokiarchaeota archaeon]
MTALEDLTLSIRRGEIIGLVGPNGAGKTTTLKLIARLIKPTAGQIQIKNLNGDLQNVRKNSNNLIEMGFLIDIPHFYDTTPYILLKHIANLRNYNKTDIKSRIDELLKFFNLYQWKYKKIKKFSKGMVQKLGFLVAIIHDPDLLILDEPQTGLDPDARIKIRKYLKTFKSKKKTILVSSHLLTELAEICDKIALINKGKLVGYDKLDNLEREFKTKVIFCEILDQLPPEQLKSLLERMIQTLKSYLEKDVVQGKNDDLITFNHESKTFKIRYDGLESSRSEILKILSTQFQPDFTISSFSEAKNHQFESLYSRLIDLKKEEKIGGQ